MLLFLHGSCIAGGGSQQVGLAQGGDDGLIDEHRQGSVQDVLAQVEGQEHRHQHGGDSCPGDTNVDGGDEEVPQ